MNEKCGPNMKARKPMKNISKTSEGYHHHDKKYDQIRKELIEYARSQWKLGFKTILIGHYHQTGIYEEGQNKLIFLGDWLRYFTVTCFDENGWKQYNWNEL